MNYLGGDMPSFALNFSRPGGQVIVQYYTFLRLGFEGFRRVQQTCRDVATSLASRLLTDGGELPVFAFTLADDVTNFSVFDVSAGLREEGWLVPAYTFPPDVTELAVLRIVVRNGMSHDLAGLFLDDLRRVLARLARQTAPLRGPDSTGFSHGTGAAPGP